MRHLLIDIGPYSLEVDVEDDVDLDDAFMAFDLNEGDYITINGWLIDNVEEQSTPRDVLAAEYVSVIGYDPFADDPAISEAEVLQTLVEYRAAVVAESTVPPFQNLNHRG